MNEWKCAKSNPPPQGKKVLCLIKGDVDVRQRFGQYWAAIPYLDSAYSDLDVPEYWQDIDLPNGLTGKVFFLVEGEKYDLDELEKAYPKAYNQVIDIYYNMNKKLMKRKNGQR